MGASTDASGFPLAAEGLHTAFETHSLTVTVPLPGQRAHCKLFLTIFYPALRRQSRHILTYYPDIFMSLLHREPRCDMINQKKKSVRDVDR